jgi:hypothetical protein
VGMERIFERVIVKLMAFGDAIRERFQRKSI